MARLPRKHIPLAIRVEVAERQMRGFADRSLLPRSHHTIIDSVTILEAPAGEKLKTLLEMLATRFGCPVKDLRLDHDPALANREKRARMPTGQTFRVVIVPKGATVLRYYPDELDPEHLLYRPHGAEHEGSHDIKTRVRGERGQFSDLALLKRERRREKKARRPKHQWAKGRKLQSRNDLRRPK